MTSRLTNAVLPLHSRPNLPNRLPHLSSHKAILKRLRSRRYRWAVDNTMVRSLGRCSSMGASRVALGERPEER